MLTRYDRGARTLMSAIALTATILFRLPRNGS